MRGNENRLPPVINAVLPSRRNRVLKFGNSDIAMNSCQISALEEILGCWEFAIFEVTFIVSNIHNKERYFRMGYINAEAKETSES
jgi:hypothetical protein